MILEQQSDILSMCFPLSFVFCVFIPLRFVYLDFWTRSLPGFVCFYSGLTLFFFSSRAFLFRSVPFFWISHRASSLSRRLRLRFSRIVKKKKKSEEWCIGHGRRGDFTLTFDSQCVDVWLTVFLYTQVWFRMHDYLKQSAAFSQRRIGASSVAAFREIFQDVSVLWIMPHLFSLIKTAAAMTKSLSVPRDFRLRPRKRVAAVAGFSATPSISPTWGVIKQYYGKSLQSRRGVGGIHLITSPLADKCGGCIGNDLSCFCLGASSRLWCPHQRLISQAFGEVPSWKALLLSDSYIPKLSISTLSTICHTA